MTVTDADPSTSADAGHEVLTGDAAGDLLAAALRASGMELYSWARRQVTYRPGRGSTVTYRAQVRSATDDMSEETLVATSGRIPEGALTLDDGTCRVGVWRFPHDPDLPGLASACDQEAVAELLGSLGAGGGPVQLRTLAYRPRRRAVVEATSPGGRLYLKVVRPDRVEALHDRHRHLAAHGLPVPQSYGWSRNGIVVLQARDGQPLRQLLNQGQAPLPDAASLTALLDRLPAEAPGGGADRTVPSWLTRTGTDAHLIGAVLPAEATRVSRLAEALVADGLEPVLPAPVHGDFYENQLLVANGAIVGLLDVDTAGSGDRLDDLACLLGHLSVLAGYGTARSGSRARHLMEEYRTAFAADVPPAELYRRVAAVVLSLATGPYRVQDQDWPVTTWDRLALAEAWLERANRSRTTRKRAPRR